MADDAYVKIANSVDVFVGARIRFRRKQLGKSQSEVAEKLGLTFQQLQKYERGDNRVSASKLYALSQILKVPVSYWFEGYEEGMEPEAFSESTSERGINDFLRTSEGVELSEAFPRVRRGSWQRKILALVTSLASDPE